MRVELASAMRLAFWSPELPHLSEMKGEKKKKKKKKKERKQQLLFVWL